MSQNASIDDELASSTDRHLTVIARLSGFDRSTTADDLTAALKQHAAQSQEPLRRFVRNRSGIEIRQSFWITNAAVLAVDTDAVSLSALAGVSGVAQLLSNATLERPGVAGDVGTTAELSVADDQENSVAAGSALSAVLSGSNVDGLTVELTGEYDESDADLSVAGQSAEFGVPVPIESPDNIPVTVETSPGTEGLLALEHTAAGPGDTATVLTGPTSVVDGSATVGIIQQNDDYGDIPGTLAGELGDAYSFEETTPESVIETPAQYDAVVVDRFDPNAVTPGIVADFIETIRNTDTGAVYLDQFGQGSDAIVLYEDVDDTVTDTYQTLEGDPSYEFVAEHPILLGFEPGEQVLLHDYDEGPANDDHTWYDTAAGSPFDRLADVVGDDVFGEALSVAEAWGSVLASSLGRTFFTENSFTDAADRILGQAVAYVASGGLTTGVTGVVEREGDPVADATVELDGSTVRTDTDGGFTLFADPGTYDLTITGFGLAETTETVTVTEESGLTDIGAVAADPVVDVAVGADQPADIVSGEAFSATLETVDAGTLTIEATGDYDTSNADLLVEGESVSFGESVDLDSADGERSVSVETTADTAGDIGLTHTVTGGDGTASGSTGPTYVFGEDQGSTVYGLAQINADIAWDAYGTQGDGASVAVLDTGANPEHPDIDVAKWSEFDSEGEEIRSDPNDTEDAFGTFVSSIATGSDSAGLWLGVAPEAALYAAKIVDDTGTGTIASLIAGIEWAVEEGADAMTVGLSVAGYEPLLIDPMDNAAAAGTFPVTPVGGRFSGESSSPGNIYGATLAVGGSTEDEQIRNWSGGEVIDTAAAWGEAAPEDWPETYTVPNVVAPGQEVTGANPPSGYRVETGSQMSSGYVAGAVALVCAAAGEHTSDNLRTALETTARKPGSWDVPDDEQDTRYGFGIVDVDAATELLQGTLAITDLEIDPVPGPGGDTELTVSADFAGQITVQSLWTDWTVTVADSDGATDIKDRVATEGEFELLWDTSLGSRTPVLVLSLSNRYTGGEYKLTVAASDGTDAVEDTETFAVTDGN